MREDGAGLTQRPTSRQDAHNTRHKPETTPIASHQTWSLHPPGHAKARSDQRTETETRTRIKPRTDRHAETVAASRHRAHIHTRQFPVQFPMSLHSKLVSFQFLACQSRFIRLYCIVRSVTAVRGMLGFRARRDIGRAWLFKWLEWWVVGVYMLCMDGSLRVCAWIG